MDLYLFLPFRKIYQKTLQALWRAFRRHSELQRDKKELLPQKLPNHYHISLHIDDETIVCNLGRQYGYNVYQLEAQDDDWKEKILARADEIRKRDFT